MRALLTTTLVICLLAPAMAVASGDAVVTDCTDNGTIDHKYTQNDYREALKNLPADAAEYTDCAELIQTAQRAGSQDKGRATLGSGGGSGSGDSGGGSGSNDSGGTPTKATPVSPAPALEVADGSPAQNALLAKAASGGSAIVDVAGAAITPGATALSAEDVSRSLPTPLLILIILLGIGGLTAAGLSLRGRWPAIMDRPKSLIDRVSSRDDD